MNRGLPVIAGFLVMIVLLYAAVLLFALLPANYPQQPPYDAMAQELTAYLSGRSNELSDLFTERERLHMVDVQGLFRGGFTIALTCFAGALAALVFYRRYQAAGALPGYLLGCGLFFAALLAMGLWALIDFSGWFTTMHTLVFTNDLWLLDPADSMLIRMLPQNFFSDAVVKIASAFVCLAAWATAGPALVAWARKRYLIRKRNG